jgi:positive regulator of sigma E activity
MTGLRYLYQLIVLYLAVHLVGYLFREKKFWAQASAVMVLALFLLRLLWIK